MEIIQKLTEKISAGVQENVTLAPYTTYKLGGPARYFFIAKNNEEVKKAVTAAAELNLPIFILGGGSNILVSDNGFNGLVIKMENREVMIEKNKIKAEAGALLGQAVSLALKNSLTGLEWAAGIPGTVGGAVRGNAGAFGQSISDDIVSVNALKILNAQTEETAMTKDECQFAYRESIFKRDDNLIVLGVELELQAGDKEGIKRQMADCVQRRTCNYPKFPSAGCSFKNIFVTDEIREKIKQIDPSGEAKIKGGKIGAGWFIDQAGLKGYKIGGAKVSDEHANFVVKANEDARAEHALMLISYVKQQVRDKFGVQLQEEVQYVGF
ncbi:MAG: UDP-N-acetylmuramate dehydrogenase [Patescibacteria group bacterium]